MGKGGGDQGGGQVIAIASSLVGDVGDVVEMVVLSSYGRDGRVDGDVCDGVVEHREHQHRSFSSMGEENLTAPALSKHR